VFSEMPLNRKVATGLITAAFLAYGFIGERAAEWVLSPLLGTHPGRKNKDKKDVAP